MASMITKIIVMSRHTLADYKFYLGTSYAIISITSPQNSQAKINFVDKDEDRILRLEFNDVDKSDAKLIAISREQAARIALFARKYWGTVEYFIVQCESGLSRSAGVAAAISKFFTDDDNYYFEGRFYVPNRLCYRYVLEALYYFQEAKYE